MRAAVVSAAGADPELAEIDDPVAGDGYEIATVEAAGLNPIDLFLASGRYAAPVPHVIGREGIACLADGTRAYFASAAPPQGATAERAAVDPRTTFPLPDGLDDDIAIALGAAGLAAWLALTAQAALQPGESVLVLGASGVVGQLASQAARALGAARVVGAARNTDAVAQEALDAVVGLGDGFDTDLRDHAGKGFDVVIDPLGGAPLEAALSTLADGGRAVTLGVMAGDTATVPLRTLQGRRLIGHSARFFDHDSKASAYAAMAQLALDGRLTVPTSRYALDDVADAWRAQLSSPNRKLLIEISN